MINWSSTMEDTRIISACAGRFAEILKSRGIKAPPQMDIAMDLTACHLNGCPLDLQRLLAAEDFDFSHDVVGIRNHIDRRTGTLRDCFVPRMAAKEKELVQ
uniref:DUF6874 domain-containing protein n=1 Tax=viral metagenome TaxID=1070528 RepID=A0A6M3JLK6_9ZZZZ